MANFIAGRCILELQDWQTKNIQEAVEKAEAKHAKFIEHSRVVDWVDSWATDNEMKQPE